MSSNAAVAASKPFRFIVGPGQREFAIHTAIVAKQSRYLETLVDGPMKEATEGKANWESVDEDTFVRFWQFAYTGDYEVWDEPCGQIAAESVAQVEEPLPEPDEPAGMVDDPFESLFGKGYNNPGKEPLWTKFVGHRQTSHTPDLSHRRSEMHAGSDAKHLLNHAKVYVFADCYGITLLMTSSYNKLHQSLNDLCLHPEASKGVVALVQYCLETDVPDGLKELVVLFVACKFEILLANARFRELLDSHGSFGRNILELSRSRLE